MSANSIEFEIEWIITKWKIKVFEYYLKLLELLNN
jgi:hypothetical protein